MTLVILMAGVALVAGAFLRLADLMQYISRSVVVGYITGAAILIITNQLRHVLGIDFSQLEEVPTSFLRVFWCTVRLLPQADIVTSCLGGGVLVLYLFLHRRFRKISPFLLCSSLLRRWSGFFSSVRGAISRPTGTRLFPAWEIRGLTPQAPDFGHPRLFDRIGQLFSLAMAIAFLSAMEQSVMAQTLGSRTGQKLDKNQDMLGVGMANLACSFLSGMPASGSLTRSALNHSSGAVSRMSSVFCGCFCLVGVVTLGPSVAYIPKTALAALVICVAISLISRKNLRICFRATFEDAVVVAITLSASLFLPLQCCYFCWRWDIDHSLPAPGFAAPPGGIRVQ